MQHRIPRPRALLTLLLVACSSTPKGSTRPQPSNDEWIQASPILEHEIDDHLARVPYLQQIQDFSNEVAWFVGVGEPAYAKLLARVRSEDDKVAGFALAVLAARGDARLVPHLELVPWPGEEHVKLRYERARCHVKLGDWKPIGVLVDGLDDEDPWNRALCFKALRDETSQTFDYHPRLEGEERAAAIRRWREWLAARDLDPLLRG